MDKGPRDYVLITNPEECDEAFEVAKQGEQPITPTKEYTVEPSQSRLKSIPAAIHVLSDDGTTVEPINVNRMALVLETSTNCHLLGPDGNLIEPTTPE